MDPVYGCIQCGKCTSGCPEAGITPFNIRIIIRKRQIKREVEGSNLWFCTSCGTCSLRCPRDIKPLDEILRLRSEFVERGTIPSSIQKALDNTFLYKNPFGRARNKRALWTEDLPFKIPHVKETEQKRLLFSCCIHAYDERCMVIPKNIALLLRAAGVEFGILYDEEVCCGNEVKRIGEVGLFEELRNENYELINKYGIKEIITLSPHCMNAFKKEYGLEIKVFHYTEILSLLLERGSLSPNQMFGESIAYHDPCFLGKQGGIFEEPRHILKKVAAQIKEFVRSKEISLCCEGGGGRMFYDPDIVYKRTAEARIEEAMDNEISAIAVACPFCLRTLEEAGREKNVKVMDLTEIVKEVIGWKSLSL